MQRNRCPQHSSSLSLNHHRQCTGMFRRPVASTQQLKLSPSGSSHLNAERTRAICKVPGNVSSYWRRFLIHDWGDAICQACMAEIWQRSFLQLDQARRISFNNAGTGQCCEFSPHIAAIRSAITQLTGTECILIAQNVRKIHWNDALEVGMLRGTVFRRDCTSELLNIQDKSGRRHQPFDLHARGRD